MSIRKPKIDAPTPLEQLKQIRNYLFQLVDELENELSQQSSGGTNFDSSKILSEVQTALIMSKQAKKIAESVKDGANGKSAYQIAVDNGFEGTETEWLASLKGKDGSVTVDTELSETSENPLQNKVITKALKEKVDKVKEETEKATYKAETALISAEQAEINAKAYTDEKVQEVEKDVSNALGTIVYVQNVAEQAQSKANENAENLDVAKADLMVFAMEQSNRVETNAQNYTNEKFSNANKTVSFYSLVSMINSLTNEYKDTYKQGQTIMISEQNVPNLWVSNIHQYISNIYNYTSAEDFIYELNTNGSVQVGWYYLSALAETQKVDLTEYAKAEDVNTELSKKLNLPTSADLSNGGTNRVSVIDGDGKTQKFFRTNSLYIYQTENNTNNAVVPLYKRVGAAFANKETGASGALDTLSNTIFVSTPQLPYEASNKKYIDDNFVQLNAKNTITGSLELPNSPDNPETARETDTYTTRETANANTTGLTVVDGSATLVKEIKGSTVRSENLINVLPIEFDWNAHNIVNNKDGSFSIRAYNAATKQTLSTYAPNLKAGETYTLTFKTDEGGANYIYLRGSTRVWYSGASVTLTQSDLDNSFNFYGLDSWGSNPSATQETPIRIWDIMINEGATPLPYQPYFADLKNAQISGIKSTGKNLINLSPLKIEIDTWDKSVWKGNIKAPCTLSWKIDISEVKNDLSAALFAFKIDGVTKYASATFNDYPIETGTLTEIVALNWCNINATIYDIMLNSGTNKLPYEPYIDDTMYLPKTLELGEWDSFNPQTGEITRATKTIVLNGTEGWYLGGTSTVSSTGEHRMAFGVSDVYRHPSSGTIGNIKCNNYNTYTADQVYMKKEGIGHFKQEISFYDKNFNTEDISLWKAHLAELYANGTPLTISYELATPTIEKLENVPVGYTVYDGGTETILGNENEKYGTKLTVTQTYSIHENPSEAATKAYVNNGLAKKLDKTGGTITGHLIVENGTTTTVPSLVVKNNENTYGLVLEENSYKLGKGSIDEKGDFKLDDGEGLPIALRNDSSEFQNEELLMWSSNGNKIVSTGITLSQLKQALGI